MALGIFIGMAIYGAIDMMRGVNPKPKSLNHPKWDQHYNIKVNQMQSNWYIYNRAYGTVVLNPN